MATSGDNSITRDEYIDIMVNSGTYTRSGAEAQADILIRGRGLEAGLEQTFPNTPIDVVRVKWSNAATTPVTTYDVPDAILNDPKTYATYKILVDNGVSEYDAGAEALNAKGESEQYGVETPFDNALRNHGIDPNIAFHDKATADQGTQDDGSGSEPEVWLPPEEEPASQVGEEEAEVQPETFETNETEINDIETIYADNKNNFDSSLENLLKDYNLDAINSNNKFATNDIDEIISSLNSTRSTLETLVETAGDIGANYSKMNEETRNKMISTISDGTLFQVEADGIIDKWDSFVLDLLSNLKDIQSKIEIANGENPPGSTTVIEELPGGGKSGYGGSSSSGSSSVGDIAGITGTDNTPDVFIESAVVGTLAFSTIVPLFDELGKPSTIQSSLTGEYDVVGIFQHEGKYYYRIYDKNLKKFYFAEIDNNSNFTTDYAEVLKMNEDAMMLSSPDIGQNVLTKMTDINEVYFVNGTLPGEGDSANITFANILDGMDGKNYYVPLSDSVEMVTLDVFKSGILGDTPTLDTNTSTDVSNNVG